MALVGLISPVLTFAKVTLEINVQNEDTLSLTYKVSSLQKILNLIDDSERTQNLFRAKYWKVSNDCFKLVGSQFIRKKQKCNTITVAVSPQFEAFDRFYPGFVPLSKTGVLIFSRYFFVTDLSNVLVKAHPRYGAIIFDSTLSRVTNKHLNPAELKNKYIYIGASPEKISKDVLLVGDPNLPELNAKFKDSLIQLIRYFDEASHIAKFAAFISFFASDRSMIHADVSTGNMLRFSQFIEHPLKRDDIELSFESKRILAHEIAHFYQKIPVTNRTPWMHEGLSEYIAFHAMASIEGITSPNITNYFSNTVQNCVKEGGNHSWEYIKNQVGGRIPYDCGFLVYFINALSQHKVLSIREWFNVDRSLIELDETKLLQKSVTIANTISRLNESSKTGQSFITFIADEFEKLFGISVVDQVSADHLNSSLIALFRELMRNDCGGTSGFWLRPSMLEIDFSGQCRNLKNGMRLTSIENFEISNVRFQALIDKAHKACEVNGELAFQGDDGSEIRLQCPSNLKKRIPEFSFDKNLLRAKLSLIRIEKISNKLTPRVVQ